MPLPVIAAAALVGLSFQITMATYGRRYKIMRWFASYSYHIHTVNRTDNTNQMTHAFKLFLWAIDVFIQAGHKTDYFNKTTTVDGKTYHSLPDDGCLGISIDLTKERQQELGLKEPKLEFWIVSNGEKNDLAIWASDKSHLSNIYQLLTLMFHHHTNDTTFLMDFTKTYTISHAATRKATYRTIIEHTQTKISAVISKGIRAFQSESLPCIMDAPDRLQAIVTSTSDLTYAVNKNEIYLGMVIHHIDDLVPKQLSCMELKRFINNISRQCSNNREMYSMIASMACLRNFVSFIEMKSQDLNEDVTDAQRESMPGVAGLTAALQTNDTIVFMNKVLAAHKHYSLLSQFLLIFYLEHAISAMESPDQTFSAFLKEHLKTDSISPLLLENDNKSI